MTINQSGWKPTTPVAGATDTGTITGNRALMLEEALIFEIGDTDTTGVDIASPSRLREELREGLSSLLRTQPIGLPGLSEPETVRHYTRLSRQNYAIDLGLFPLLLGPERRLSQRGHEPVLESRRIVLVQRRWVLRTF